MTRSLCLLIGLLLLGSACATPMGFRLVPQSSLSESATKDPDYRKGLERLASGDYRGARLAFQQSLARHPDSAPAMLGLSEAASRLGKNEEAGQWMKKAVSTAPENYHTQLSWGRYLRWVKGDLSAAREAFRKAAALRPEAPEVHIALGDVSLLLGQPRQAMAAYEQSLAISPDNAAAHYALGVARFRAGDPSGARTALEKAAELAPQNPLPLLQLARIQQALGATEDALQAIDKAEKRDPHLMAAPLLRARILAQSGRHEEAQIAYQKLASRYPQRAEPLIGLAMLHQQQGQNKMAISLYRKSISIDPRMAVAYNNLAWLLGAENKKLGEAVPLAEKAVKLAPAVGAYHDTLGWLYWLQGRTTDSCATYRKGMRLAPDDPSLKAHWKIVKEGC